MKKIIFILFISISIFAQERTEMDRKIKFNPDGNAISIHFTPYFYRAGIKEYNYSYTIPSTFGYDVKVKYPVSLRLTLSLFYNKIELDTEIPQLKFNGYRNVRKIGMTFSYYFY